MLAHAPELERHFQCWRRWVPNYHSESASCWGWSAGKGALAHVLGQFCHARRLAGGQRECQLLRKSNSNANSYCYGDGYCHSYCDTNSYCNAYGNSNSPAKDYTDAKTASYTAAKAVM